MLLNIIKESFVNVIKYPIVALFLVLYFIIISILMSCLSYQTNIIIGYTLVFTSFLFIAIFSAGWFRIIKEIATTNNSENEEDKKNIIAVFLESIGQNVIPYAISLTIYIFFSVIFAYIAFLIAIKLFGNPQELILKAQASGDALAYINSLPQDEMAKIYAQPISFMISVLCCLFLFMYYFPSIIFSTEKNMFLKPLIGLKDNFRFLFKHFFQSIGIYLLLCIINITFVYIKTTRLPEHYIIDILYLFYIVYFLSFAVMLICNYYGKNYSGSNGSDCIGENESNDSSGEEN